MLEKVQFFADDSKFSKQKEIRNINLDIKYNRYGGE